MTSSSSVSTIASHMYSAFACYTDTSFQFCIMPFSEILPLFVTSERNSDVQRDHVARAPKSKGLHCEFTKEMLEFVATYRTDTGELRLEDGFTRIECVRTGLATCSAPIRLKIHAVRSSAEQREVYEQLNNPNAVKRGSHFVEGGLRAEGLLKTFKSSLLAKGRITYAIRKAGSMLPHYDATRLMAPALRELDKKLWDCSTWNSSGLVAAYLALARLAAEKPAMASDVSDVLDILHSPAFVLKRSMGLGGRIWQIYHKFYTLKHASGAVTGKNVDVILQMALGAFHDAQTLAAAGYVRLPKGYTITPMSVNMFNLTYL